mgnify:CR=1 FL=1
MDKEDIWDITNSLPVILYKSDDGKTKVDVVLQGDTAWLTQDQMAELFNKGRSTITEHINNVFKEMDSDPMYGGMWREYKKEIAEFSKMLPIEKQNMPDLKDLKTLFLAAVESRGDTEKIMIKAYETKLKKIKENSISKTGDSIDKNSKRQFKSIKESFLNAVGEN